MKILKNELKKELNIRTEKDYPIKGVEFIDIMPLFLQKDVLNEIKSVSDLNNLIRLCSKENLKKYLYNTSKK